MEHLSAASKDCFIAVVPEAAKDDVSELVRGAARAPAPSQPQRTHPRQIQHACLLLPRAPQDDDAPRALSPRHVGSIATAARVVQVARIMQVRTVAPLVQAAAAAAVRKTHTPPAQ